MQRSKPEPSLPLAAAAAALSDQIPASMIRSPSSILTSWIATSVWKPCLHPSFRYTSYRYLPPHFLPIMYVHSLYFLAPRMVTFIVHHVFALLVSPRASLGDGMYRVYAHFVYVSLTFFYKGPMYILCMGPLHNAFMDPLHIVYLGLLYLLYLHPLHICPLHIAHFVYWSLGHSAFCRSLYRFCILSV